ncbi:hypothetical protein ABEDC_2398 [Acinetobacter lwoffii]|nr:hypothetical protein ABEDC_2398 [Acinetobacter lwoffii]
MACEIIDQIFGQVVQLANSPDSESEKVIQQIMHNTRKYMPWSVSLFGNERLMPMVNYLHRMTYEHQGDAFVRYPVEKLLVMELLGCIDQMKNGNHQYVSPALKAFTQVVDQGVTHLIREPKKMLKFNVVVDKTLNGVIHLTTQLGYKRFDKLGSIYDADTMSYYFEHLLAFLEDEMPYHIH